MHEFRLHRSSSVDEAVAAHSRGIRACYLAGGQSLIPALKLRLASPGDVVDVSGIRTLKGIELLDGAVLRIGALETHASIAESPLVRDRLPVLASLALRIGDQMVRNCGTLGGAIASNDPAGDWPAAVLGLGAEIRTERRSIVADEFFRGAFTTALERDELIVSVEFPPNDAAEYVKFPSRVGVFVARVGRGVRVAITGGVEHVHRVPALEGALEARFHEDAVAAWSPDVAAFISNLHASAAYRAALAKVGARRAVGAIAASAAR
jgi:carbon-monoxide dehydrogenase medium subunit